MTTIRTLILPGALTSYIYTQRSTSAAIQRRFLFLTLRLFLCSRLLYLSLSSDVALLKYAHIQSNEAFLFFFYFFIFLYLDSRS